jgi:hypothetical protein
MITEGTPEGTKESPLTAFESAEELLAGQLGEVGRLQCLLSRAVPDAAAFEDRRIEIWRALASVEEACIAAERAAGL